MSAPTQARHPPDERGDGGELRLAGRGGEGGGAAGDARERAREPPEPAQTAGPRYEDGEDEGGARREGEPPGSAPTGGPGGGVEVSGAVRSRVRWTDDDSARSPTASASGGSSSVAAGRSAGRSAAGRRSDRGAGVGRSGANRVSILLGGWTESDSGERIVTMPRMEDHFSLETPSSAVRFRTAHVRVYERPNSQFVVEETTRDGDGDGDGGFGETVLTVKHVSNGTTALRMLRASYALVSAFCGGFMLIFSMMLLLYQFLDLATEAGLTHQDKNFNVFSFISILLSVPVFNYSLSSTMAIMGSFVADTWRGHVFLRSLGNWSVVITEWISFLVYIGTPLITMIITLFMGHDEWWAISLLVWFAAILLLFGFFAACVLYYDISACLYLFGTIEDPIYGPLRSRRLKDKFRRAVLLTQSDRFGGEMTVRRTHAGALRGTDIEGDRRSDRPTDAKEKVGPYARLTLCCGGLFRGLDPPVRSFSTEEVCGVTPFVTSSAWSLEKIYCQDRRRGRQITVMRGPSALRGKQVKSSCACAVIGNALVIGLILSLMVWFGTGPAIIAAVTFLVLLCFVPSFRGSYHMYKKYRDVFMQAEGGGAAVRSRSRSKSRHNLRQGSVASQAIYQITECYRITSPHPALCLVISGFQVAFFFLWPAAYLFSSGNYPIGTLFVGMGLFSGIRHYLNAAVALKVLGSFGTLGEGSGSAVFGLDLTPQGLKDNETHKQWKARCRLSKIVRNITRGRARNVFSRFFFFFVLICLVLVFMGMASSEGQDSEQASNSLVILHDFEYKPKAHLPYPTCQMSKGLDIPSAEKVTDMIDYVFLGSVAYTGGHETQKLLDQWFGEGRAIDHPELIDWFRNSRDEYGDSPVHYKFITFPRVPGFGVLAIRGTSNGWDLLTDAQLWGAAGLFQLLRVLLPIGEAFTPILHRVVNFVSMLETQSIKRVSYYRETSAFIKWLWSTENFTNIHITGHSLGGGLALITGAQTNTPAVGISAPNAMLSRDTFDPPVTKEQLNTLTFNIVPKRDLIPMIDDKADLYQMIECRASANAFVDCHMSVRSLCEIMYSCGTGGRPATCICAEELGYPPPVPTGNRTFEEACPNYKPPV